MFDNLAKLANARIMANCSAETKAGTAARHRMTYRQQARVLKALAHEARLMIVDRLLQGECSAGALTKLVGLDASTVSKHLALLRSHGIVDDRREGSTVYYRLLTPCVASFFSCASQVINGES